MNISIISEQDGEQAGRDDRGLIPQFCVPPTRNWASLGETNPAVPFGPAPGSDKKLRDLGAFAVQFKAIRVKSRLDPLILIELEKAGLKVEAEKSLKVYYQDQVVGDFSIDILVEEEVVLELKSVENLARAHEVQLVNYLKGLGKDIGLLINFGPEGVEVKRKYRQVKEMK